MQTLVARCVLLVLKVLAVSALAHAQCHTHWVSRSNLGGASGSVNVRWDPDGPGPLSEQIVTGGVFPEAGGQPAANIAAFDLAAGTWSPLGAGVGGRVAALAVLPTGELVAAGSFQTAGGTPANHVAVWNGSVWSPLGAGLSDDVGSLAVLPNGRLVAGGRYSSSGATAVGFVAQWDGLSWSPLGAFPFGYGQISSVQSLLVTSAGDLIAGTQASSAAAVLRWNGLNWSWFGSFPANGSIGGAAVWALAELPNGDLAAGGDIGYLASVWDGASWSAIGANSRITGFVYSLAVASNGVLWLAGNLYTAWNPSEPVVVWNGNSCVPLGSGLSGAGGGLVVLANGDLVASGPALGGPVSHVRWNGTSWSALAPSTALNFRALALAKLSGGDFVVGGEFTYAGQVAVNKIARRSGAQWVPFGTGLGSSLPGGAVFALAVLQNGDIVAGGGFSVPAGPAAQSIARWDGVAWVPLGGGLGISNTYALAVLPNGDLIAGGTFTTAGGNAANCIARWDGNAWFPLGTGMGGPYPRVTALAVLPNGDVIAGGVFTTAGGASANNIARWDGSAWLPLGAGIVGGVNALAVLPDGDVVAGGMFTTAGGVSASNIARWNGSSWAPLGTGSGGWYPSYATVHALAVLPNGDVLAGGEFGAVGGVPAASIARWNGSMWSAVDGGMQTAVYALAPLASGEIVAAGEFGFAGAAESRHVALLSTDCIATAFGGGIGCSGSGGANVLAAHNSPWTGSTFRATASGLPANALAAVLWGLQSASTALATLSPLAGPGCMLLASPDAVVFALPIDGALATSLAIPNSTAFAGIRLHEQVVTAETNAQGAIVAITSSNALRLTIGSL